MERTEIIKALECCTKAESWGDCEEMGCPAHTKQGCHYYLRTDDDYENTIYIELCKDALSLIKELTEGIKARDDTISRFIETMPLVKADTVQKMQERLKEKAYTNNYCQEVVLLSDIGQIAKEMIEGETK